MNYYNNSRGSKQNQNPPKKENKGDEVLQLPEIVFYKDKSKGLISDELFKSTADKCAETIKRAKKGETNKPTQLRKFFDEVLMLKSRIQQGGDFEKIKPYIGMIMAKVKYAKGRKHITQEFVNLFEKCLNQIETKEDFYIFVDFLEAFMGYLKYYIPKE
ncbi:MAG: type III-A CRISPR-associated protein Csm2 [Acidobacteria bacterium]|nr:type III-A CRISPR-associated protein Csm2 [Acidobacteriota bacterium]